MVLLTVGQGGFMISARLEAMQDGRMGEQIQLRNRESGRIMTGVVKGPNQALGV
ncbi:MAG: flagella basal body P-ring formation protein FlgA [Limnohabitans sp.]